MTTSVVGGPCILAIGTSRPVAAADLPAGGRGEAGRGGPDRRLHRRGGRRPRGKPLLLAPEDRHQGDPDGKASTWAETGSPNGHKVLADGTHLICDASRHAVLHLDADGKELAPASTTSDGQPIRGPNDLTLDPELRRRLLHRSRLLQRNPPRRHGSLHRPPGSNAHRRPGSGLPQRHRDPPRRQGAARRPRASTTGSWPFRSWPRASSASRRS